MGISCNIIKPKEVAKLHPLVNIHDLVGALHLPADAVVSPPDVNHALAVAAAGQGDSNSRRGFDRLTPSALLVPLFVVIPFLPSPPLCLLFTSPCVFSSCPGVQILERTSVQQVLVEKGHVMAVETDRGSIECEYFVNCAGQVNFSMGLCGIQIGINKSQCQPKLEFVRENHCI